MYVTRRMIIDIQKKIVEMYVTPKGVEEVVERERGWLFIWWTFDRRLGENNTPLVNAKFRQHINLAFYVCYSYAYVIVNSETRLKMIYCKQCTLL